MNEAVDRARKIARDPVSAARDAKERTGRPVVGMLSSWVPDAYVLAAGGLGLRFAAGIEGRPRGTRARAHFQAASCFYCQNVLEMGLEGELDFLDAMFFVQSCDTQQNLSDVWKMVMPDVPAVDLYVPVNRRSDGATTYLLAEMQRAADELGAILGGKIDEDSLGRALDERARVKTALSALYDARLESEGRVGAEDFYAACVASSCLPPDESIPLVEAARDAIGSGEIVSDAADVSCVIAGSVIPYPGIYTLLDTLAVGVRDDDLSIGRRLFDHPVPEQGDPIERIAEGLLGRSVGATKHDTGMDRGGGIAKIARRAEVGHVLLPLLKFCDPWAWDYPRLRDRLEDDGIGCLLVEIAGDEDLAAGTVRNRIEAYFEMDRVEDLF